MSEIYSSGQAKELFSVWPRLAKWFVIGGPADGDEAQTVVDRHPHVQCIGFEPSTELYKKQLSMRFPGKLHNYALWSRTCTLELSVPVHGPRSGSMVHEFADAKYRESVIATTLDSELALNPFMRDVVLWLDCEGAELEILAGGAKFLERCLLINLESRDDAMTEEYNALLLPLGFRKLKTWNVGAVCGMCDVIYGRDS